MNNLRAILLYGIRQVSGDESAFEDAERADMICTEYRIMPVYYGEGASHRKAAFLAVEESIYEIPLFGEAESITLRDEKVDAAWTDRLKRTFADLGLEWREPSWHLEVIGHTAQPTEKIEVAKRAQEQLDFPKLQRVDACPLDSNEHPSYVNDLVRRYLQLSEADKKVVNLDHRTEWRELSKYFGLKSDDAPLI
jgi:hypothetical protein